MFDHDVESAPQLRRRIEEISDQEPIGKLRIERPGLSQTGGRDVEAGRIQSVLHRQGDFVPAAATGHERASVHRVLVKIFPESRRSGALIPKRIVRLVMAIPIQFAQGLGLRRRGLTCGFSSCESRISRNDVRR